jgi:hypothetical protein
MQAHEFWKAQGFKEIGTGGGCEAWERKFGDAYVLVTDMDAGLPETLEEPVMIGFYHEAIDSSESVVTFECATSADALALLQKSDLVIHA